MKKLMMTLCAAAAVGLSWAKGVEQISVVENEIATIQVPFGIKSYMPSNKEVVRIEELSGTSLRITALKRGRCDLEVLGDKDLVQKYEITVLGDLATTLETLTSELDQVQEVRARIVGDFIRIDGEISAIQKWEYLQKVLVNYKGVVHNFAVFNPGPDVMLRLKDTLQEAGFTVVFQPLGKDRKAWPANQIALSLNKQTRIMLIQGRVWTPEQQAKVSQCLSTERWLTLDMKPASDSASVDEFRIRGQFDVFVDKPQIRISVAYMAIGDEDVKNIGNKNAQDPDNSPLGVGGLLSSLGGIVGDRGSTSLFGGGSGNARGVQNSMSYGASLNVVARFFKSNGLTTMSDTGYTVLESWDKEGGKFKSGGTMFVQTMQPSQGSGDTITVGSTQLKEIPYGFELATVGGVTADGNKVDVAVDFSLSSVTFSDRYSYDRKEEKTKQKMILDIGKTTFLGGRKMLEDNRTSPSGLPFLRNTPMLNWFVADSGTELNDKRLVIMICPEIVDNTKEGTFEVEKEINIPVPTEGAKPTEQREEEKMPHEGGYWNPLNWFRM